jgi:putative tricarboxylic transport membrane protein
MDNSDSKKFVDRVNRRGFLKAGALAGITSSAGCVSSFTGGQSNYPSEDITVIASGTGSLFDFWARGYSQFLSEELEPDVVVENVSGAGGTASASETFNADSDGYTVGTLNIPGQRAAQLTLDVNYELEDMPWIGQLANYPYTLFVNPDSEFQSLDDLRNADRELVFTDPGFGSTSSLVTVIANDIFGIDNYRIVTGFDSGVAALNPVIQGDADARFQIGEPIVDMIEGGDVRPIIALLEESPAYAPDVSNLSDVGGEATTLSNFALQAFIGAPPEVEDSRLDTLRSATDSIGTSDEMQQWAEDNPPLGRGFAYEDSQACAETVSNVGDKIGEYSDLIQERFNQ